MAATYEQVFENNKRWVEEKKGTKADFFDKLAEGQQPDYLYIGCADSRVPPNQVMDLEPGDVFVHRNVANMVVNTDLNVMSVINYAVMHLKVKHVVVCGHTNCGGVKAAMSSQDLGVLNPWLRNIRDVYKIHRNELDAIEDEDARYNRLIELNVVEQCNNVLQTPEVQQQYAASNFPSVHGWVFDLKTGLLKDLNIDYKSVLESNKNIYNVS